MKLFKKKEIADSEIAADISKGSNTIMAPVGEDGKPLYDKIVSHAHNSHTLKPKLVADPPKYGDEYLGLEKYHAVDFPGMFESKGPELDTALYLTLQKVLLEAKSAKVLVLVSAHIFLPDNVHMVR